MTVESTLRALVTDLIAEHGGGYELYDLQYGGHLVRVLVDREDGIDTETLGRLTKAISRQLDEVDPIAGSYTLEVSSPGVERPLRTAEHFQRAVDERVSVKCNPGVDGPRRRSGRVQAADEEALVLIDDDGSAATIRYEDIAKARTTYDWAIGSPPQHPRKAASS